MTVFKATQAVNLNASGLASAFSFLTSSPHVEVANSTEFKLENGAHTVEIDFKGNGFTYGLHGPTGGTITSLQVNKPAGSIAFKFSSMSVSITTLASDISHGNY